MDDAVDLSSSVPMLLMVIEVSECVNCFVILTGLSENILIGVSDTLTTAPLL